MKIVYRQGDLTQASERVLVHGCNAQGVMGSGVAKAIRDSFPEAYAVYEAKHRRNKMLRLGEVVWAQSNGRVIGNMITQQLYGRDGRRYASYDALADGFEALDQFATNLFLHHEERLVAMPRIGAGLGGGNWRIVEAIIEATATNYQPVVYDL